MAGFDWIWPVRFPLLQVPQDMSACEPNAPIDDGPARVSRCSLRRVSVLQAPCQILFLLAALWAACVPLVWLLPPGGVPERAIWHARELVQGVAGGAAGGICSRPFRPGRRGGAVRRG
ncbi:NnrS family protein [Pannonibacter phragmitetus]|uniref:NnrS family protein n=1 Tax=Pannonibacter phragmitetus TaxID=121719 RepID=UPI003D2F4DE9